MTSLNQGYRTNAIAGQSFSFCCAQGGSSNIVVVARSKQDGLNVREYLLARMLVTAEYGFSWIAVASAVV
jgi:hypothetical protein